MSIARLTADIHAALGPGPSYFVFEGSSKSTDLHLSLNFRTERALTTVGDSNHHGVPYHLVYES